ncbi:MAG: DUF4139 domain-containing protein [Rhodanobacteraceae bacterium]|nr:DUF4139 domain-containing protein [Rhodanobacteraceae bacterium]
MRFFALTLLSAAMTTTTAAASNENPDYALTVYSSAAPGSIDMQRLANYGQNLPGYALVRDRRQMFLPDGRGELRFTDVAAHMDPTTVSFSALDHPDGTRVVEQNFQFDLVDAQKLLQRYIGERVRVDQNLANGTETLTGQLLSASGGMTLKLDSGEIATLTNWSGLRFPSLPGGLITKPTLVWLLDSAKGGSQPVEVAYQTQGMTWWTDYNATLDESGGKCRLDLSSWVTLVNQSGGSYDNAQLKLVAGEVNRAPAAPAPVPQAYMRKSMVADAIQEEGFSESGLFEYHLYTLGRRTTLPDNSTKQLELFPAAVGINCKKELVFTAGPGARSYWGSPVVDQNYATMTQGEVGAYLRFENKKDNQLGLALPAGRMRVNQRSDNGSLEFIGEDVIKHTPRNETLNIKLGKSFDVVGDRKQTDFKADTNARWMEESFEISVRNRKEEAVSVVIRDYLYRWSTWEITSESSKHVKRDAQTVDFPVEIPADGEVKLRYTVRYTW